MDTTADYFSVDVGCRRNRIRPQYLFRRPAYRVGIFYLFGMALWEDARQVAARFESDEVRRRQTAVLFIGMEVGGLPDGVHLGVHRLVADDTDDDSDKSV